MGAFRSETLLHPNLIMHSEVIGTTVSLEMLIFGFQKNVVRISRKSVTHNPLEDRLSSLSSGLSLAQLLALIPGGVGGIVPLLGTQRFGTYTNKKRTCNTGCVRVDAHSVWNRRRSGRLAVLAVITGIVSIFGF